MDNIKIEISIVIPAYNEDKNLEDLMEKIDTTFSNSFYLNQYEVIIINDGSTDDSENIGKKLSKKYNKLTFINLKENVSKAYSLDTGIYYSKGNIIATMDADMQYNPDDLIKMINLIYEGADIVNGKRENRKDTLIIKSFSKIYNFILRSVFNMELGDFFCGIKVFKKKIYDLMEYSGLARFVIFFSKKYKFNINEIEIQHSLRTKGKTAYSFIDRIVLSIKDIFTLFICIKLERNGFYQVKQVILSIYFFFTLFFIFAKIFFNVLNDTYFYYFISSFSIFFIIGLIIETFLKSKERDTFNLKKNIKSIIDNKKL